MHKSRVLAETNLKSIFPGYMHYNVHCSTAHNSQDMEAPTCPSTEEWIKKMYYIYTTDCYSVIKKDEIMPFAVTWMDLESVILNELSQTEKEKYRMASPICDI